MASAARDALRALALVRKGRSRCWVDDHGWWLINVEFQPSGYAKGRYLNVGEQHFWVVRDYLCFEDLERPLGASAFVAFAGDEATFTTALGPAMQAAVAAVERRRTQHGVGVEALRRLAAARDDLNAGIAEALLGDPELARGRLGGRIHEADRDTADGYRGLTAGEAADHAWSAVNQTRGRLGLRSVETSNWNT